MGAVNFVHPRYKVHGTPNFFSDDSSKFFEVKS